MKDQKKLQKEIEARLRLLPLRIRFRFRPLPSDLLSLRSGGMHAVAPSSCASHDRSARRTLAWHGGQNHIV